MNFILKDKLLNVGDWQIIKSDLIYVSNYEIKSYNKQRIIAKLEEYWGIEFYPKVFNVVTKDGLNTFHNYEGHIIKKSNRIRYYHIFSENAFIWYDRSSKKTKHNEIEIFNDRIEKLLLKEDYAFFDKNNVAYKVNINNGKLIWKFPLSQFGKFVSDWGEERDYEIEQFIGIYNDVLWIKASFFSGGLIGLDVQTGELRHQLKVSDKLIGTTGIKSIKEDKVPFYRCNYSLLEDGRIIGLAIDIYYEIDLISDIPIVTTYGLDEEYHKFGIHNQDIRRNSILKGNLLYFYNTNQHIFAILDIETKKIIYVSNKISVPDTENAWGQLIDLKVFENKVYLLDSTRTLHIYEREITKNDNL